MFNLLQYFYNSANKNTLYANNETRLSFKKSLQYPKKTASSAILCFLVILNVKQALAFDGFNWFGKEKTPENQNLAQPKTYKAHVSIIGLSKIDKKEKEKIKESSKLFTEEKEASQGSVGLLTKARDDYSNILYGLYAQGYYGGSVSIKINGQEAANIPPETILPNVSNIEISIHTGPIYHFSQAYIFNDAPPVPKKEKNFLKTEQFQDGKIAKSSAIIEAEEDAIKRWRYLSHAKAKIEKRIVIADHKKHTIQAIIIIDPGKKARYGTITIENISPKPAVKPDFILWMTGLKPGKPYNPDDIKIARDRLQKLAIFQSETIVEDDKIQKNGELNLKIIVQERKPHRIGIGGVYSTIDGLGINAYAIHRNIFGHGESLRFDAKVNNVITDPTKSDSNLSKSLFSATYITPGTFHPDNDFLVTIKKENALVNNYDLNSFTLQTGFNYKLQQYLTGNSYLNLSKIYSQEYNAQNKTFSTLSISSDLILDTRESILNPTFGHYLQAAIEPTYEMNYHHIIGKLTSEARTYIPLEKNHIALLALRANIGSIFGAPTEEIPYNFLFFSGGGGSVRGFGYHTIGIAKPDGKIQGGRSLFEASAELRFSLTPSVGLAAFIDTGIVGEKPFIDNFKAMKTGTGLGIRYFTGIGPIRFDVAWPVEKEKDNNKYSFYLGIGQAF